MNMESRYQQLLRLLEPTQVHRHSAIGTSRLIQHEPKHAFQLVLGCLLLFVFKFSQVQAGLSIVNG